MGLTKVTTKLTSLKNGGGSYETVFLVDTGAMDSLVPGKFMRCSLDSPSTSCMGNMTSLAIERDRACIMSQLIA